MLISFQSCDTAQWLGALRVELQLIIVSEQMRRQMITLRLSLKPRLINLLSVCLSAQRVITEREGGTKSVCGFLVLRVCVCDKNARMSGDLCDF